MRIGLIVPDGFIVSSVTSIPMQTAPDVKERYIGSVRKVTVGINHWRNLLPIATLAPPIRLIYGRVGGGRSLNWIQEKEGTSWRGFCHHTQRSASKRKGWETGSSLSTAALSYSKCKRPFIKCGATMRRESALCKKVSMDGLQARICKLFEEGSIAHPNSVFFFSFSSFYTFSNAHHWSALNPTHVPPSLATSFFFILLTRNMQIFTVYG